MSPVMIELGLSVRCSSSLVISSVSLAIMLVDL